MSCAQGLSCPRVEQLEKATYTLSAIRAVSDLLCNAQLQASMGMVKPENMEALITILADRLEQELAFG